MDEFLQEILLYEIAKSYFEEAVDDEVATVFASIHQWHRWKGDIDHIAEVILNGLNEKKLYEEGIFFTDSSIESFKMNDIPNALCETLKKYNVSIDVKIENRSLWVRSK